MVLSPDFESGKYLCVGEMIPRICCIWGLLHKKNQAELNFLKLTTWDWKRQALWGAAGDLILFPLRKAICNACLDVQSWSHLSCVFWSKLCRAYTWNFNKNRGASLYNFKAVLSLFFFLISKWLKQVRQKIFFFFSIYHCNFWVYSFSVLLQCLLKPCGL